MISTLLYVYYNFCTPGGVSDFTYANTSPLKKKIDYKPFPKRENFWPRPWAMPLKVDLEH